MAEFEKGILGFIPEDEWIDVGFEVTRQNDPIDSLMGDTRTSNLVAYYQTLASEYQIPMMAQFHGFDTEAQTTFRVPIDTHNIEKGLIKVKMNQSERMRALLRTGIRNDDLYDYVVNDGVRLAEQVITRTKVAKNELLASGQVTIDENNLKLTVNYGVDENQTKFKINFDEAQDVPEQIQKIIDAASDKGITLNTLVTSKAMISKMRKHKSIQTIINGNYEVGAIVRRSVFDEFMNEEFGISQIITNDLTYGANSEIDKTSGRPKITTQRYYPANRMTFLSTNPNGQIGEGLWGDPPEADMNGYISSGTSSQSPYVYISQWQENDPAVLWTKASALFIPVLYNPSSLWIATESSGE